jgi:EAL domain-containing protein (putative c-di-GMP-specific phosphodiesterase class I)
LPFTELKIDQCFVSDAAIADDSRQIVKSVIDLAHALGLIAVAEGVEDSETLALLADLGCDQVQGYYVARPMNPGNLVPWILETRRRWQQLGTAGNRIAS